MHRKFVDLFACGGGATVGATCAGHEPVLAVDWDIDALAIHKANHKDCAHLCIELGTPESAEIVTTHSAFPKSSEVWHLHVSPPCNNLCSINQATHGGSDADRTDMDKEGMRLVDWSIEFVLDANPTTWSFENVTNPVLLARLTEFRNKYPEFVDFGVFKLSEYGLPAERTRILAGTPSLINRFRTLEHRRCTPQMVFQHHKLPMPSNYIAGSGRENSRPVTTASFTVTGAELAFTDKRTATVRTMTMQELGVMQSFPLQYDWQLDRTCQFRMPSYTAKNILTPRRKAGQTIGNALPPLIAALLLGATYDEAEAAGLLTPAANRPTQTGDDDEVLLARPPGGGLYVSINGRGAVKTLTMDAAKQGTSKCVHHIGGSSQSCTLTRERIASIKKRHGSASGKRCKYHEKGWRTNYVVATATSMAQRSVLAHALAVETMAIDPGVDASTDDDDESLVDRRKRLKAAKVTA